MMTYSNFLPKAWIVLAICNLVYFILPVSPFAIRLMWLIVIVLGIVVSSKVPFNRFDYSILLFEFIVLVAFFLNNASFEITYTNLANTSISLLSFVFFHRLSSIKQFDGKFMLFCIVGLTIAAIIGYYHKLSELIIKLMLGDDDFITVNASSIFLMIFPLSFVIKNRKLAFVLVTICVYYVLISAKRGNIIALSLPLLLFIWYCFKDAKKNNFRKILIICIVILGCLWIFNYIQTNEYFQHRIDQTLKGKSSGRDFIYSTYWDLWANKSSVLKWLFGYGYEGTLVYGGISKFAHNDWLEILVDFGFIGFILYLNVLISLIFQIRNLKELKPKIIIITISYIWFVKSMVSMGFTSESLAYMALPYGYVVVLKNREKKE